MTVRHLGLVAVGAAVISACTQQQTASDAASEDDMSAHMSNGMDNHMDPMGNMGMQAQGPFAASERSIHQKMMAAVGVDRPMPGCARSSIIRARSTCRARCCA